MKKLLLAVTVILLICLSHCSQGKNKGIPDTLIPENTTPLNLVPQIVKSVNISDTLYPHVSNDSQLVYLYGISSAKGPEKIVLRIFDDRLNPVREKFFSPGQGPGDLGGGSHFFPMRDFIYVPDNTLLKVNIFDKNLEFVRFENLPGYLPITMIKEGKYFIGTRWEYNRARSEDTYTTQLVTFPRMKKTTIHILGPIITKTTQKKSIFAEQPEFYYFYRHHKNIDMIYYINMKSYRIIQYDFDGNIIKKIRVNVDIKRVPPEKKMEWLVEQTGRMHLHRKTLTDWVQPAARVVPLEKGFVVVRRKDYSMDCEGMVEGDYFNYDLEMLGKVQFPCYFWIKRVNSGYFNRSVTSFGGHLYLASEKGDEYFLEKWKLNE